jgi:kinesin family member 1
VTKAGPVAVWDQTKSEWTRKFLALRRPYLYLYSSPHDLDEEAVMSIFSLRLDHGERLTDMLNVPHPMLTESNLEMQVSNVFAIYTSFNSFLIQARSLEDMQDWITKIDRNYNVERTEGNGIEGMSEVLLA